MPSGLRQLAVSKSMSGAAEMAFNATMSALASRSQREVMKSGREKVQQSAPLWRRVTDGQPCGFCAMVASRGPVYGSAQAAGDGNQYHDHCGCTVEPFHGDPREWEPTPDEQRFIDAYHQSYESGMDTGELSDAIEARLAEHDSELDDWARWKANRDVRIGPADAGRLDFDPDNPLSIYGDRIVIEDESEIAAQHLRDLESLPRGVHETLADHFGQQDGSGFYIGDRAMPELDDLGDLRGVQPRGWPPGATWDRVPGAYDPNRRVVAAGGGGNGHGSISLAMHEGSHALDHALGQVSMSTEFVDVFHKVHATAHMNPYLTHPGNPSGYLNEGFAEGFAAWSKGRAAGASGDDLARAVGDALIKGGPRGGSYDVDAMRGLSDYFERLEESARRR